MTAAALALLLLAAPKIEAAKSVLAPAAKYELAVYWVGKAPTAAELKKLVTEPTVSIVPADMAKYAPPDEETLGYFGRGMSPAQKAEVQKATGATRFIVDVPSARRFEVYRLVLAAVGAAAKKWKGYPWDEATRELFSVDEWQKRRVDGWHDGFPDVQKHIVGHFYDNEPAGHRLVTLGMQKFAVPDLSVDGATTAFGKYLLTLANLTAAQLIRKPELGQGGQVVMEGEAVDGGAASRITVQLAPAEPQDGDAPNALLGFVFPGKGPLTTRMAALLKATLGFEDETISARSSDAALNAARDRARARIPDVKRRFPGLKAALESLTVKAPFGSEAEGGTEYMWVEVQRWHGDRIVGVLTNEPEYARDLKRGDIVTVKEGDLFDWTIHLRDGGTEGGETNAVLQRMQR